MEYRIWNMGYRRINPHPSLPSPPSHTHTYTNSIPMDSWSISRLSETIPPLVSLCVHRDALTIPLGSLCVHRDAPSDKPPIKIPPHPGFYVLCYISYNRQHGSVCVLARCEVQSAGIFVALRPTCVALSRYVSSPVA